jgi:hypothetical protein
MLGADGIYDEVLTNLKLETRNWMRDVGCGVMGLMTICGVDKPET